MSSASNVSNTQTSSTNGNLSLPAGGSIIAYTRNLIYKAGPVNKDSVYGCLAKEILTTGLALVNLFDEYYPYPLVFSNSIEPLVRRLVVHAAALALDRKKRGAFYEKNLVYLCLGLVALSKSLKQLS